MVILEIDPPYPVTLDMTWSSRSQDSQDDSVDMEMTLR
jgi:hypothetical protein